MRFKSWALAIIGLSLAFPAMSEDMLSSHNSYLAINAGKSSSPGSCATTFIPGGTCSEKSTVFRLGYGYHFTPTWGVELSYGDFGQAKSNGMMATPPGVPGSGQIPYDWTWDAVGWEVAATGALHFGDSISMVGKLGYVLATVGQEAIITTSTNEIWHAVTHENSHGFSAGIGAQYDLNRDYALRIQYENFGKLGSTSKIKVSATSLGFLLKF